MAEGEGWAQKAVAVAAADEGAESADTHPEDGRRAERERPQRLGALVRHLQHSNVFVLVDAHDLHREAMGYAQQ